MLYDHDAPIILIRGAPGSGKSTFAKFTGRLVVEADGYFTVGDDYLFDAERLPEAHSRCLFLAKSAVAAGRKVAVANTFSREWELRDYRAIWPDAPIIRLSGKWTNVHGVPACVVARIRDRMEDIPGEIAIGEAV